MNSPGSGIPRPLALLAVVALIAAACGSPAASPGTGTPGTSPGTRTPGTSPGTGTPGTSPGTETAPPATPGVTSTPSAEACPDTEVTPGEQIGGTVTVIGTWGGDEEQSFLCMVKPFEEATGVDVQYTGTRDLEAILTAGIASGTVQDVAGLPGPGQMQQWAEDGALIDLGTVLDRADYEANTAPAFVELGDVDGALVGVFIKTTAKGFFWYNTANFTGDAPATWDELVALPSDPAESKYCVAFESGADSGWPGTDWIEDIVLRQSGADVYDAWVRGEVDWTGPEIKGAFEAFRDEVLAKAHGGANYINNTPFGQGGNPLFDDPPGCLFHHQASFITASFIEEAGATADQFDFFPFPDINPDFAGSLEGGGDLFGMFRDTPQSRALMNYLVTAEAQQIWVDRGGALSANVNVTQYPDEISTRLAGLLRDATTLRFDAGDLMGGQVNSTFFSSMVQFADNPDNLDSILANLQQVHQDSLSQ